MPAVRTVTVLRRRSGAARFRGCGVGWVAAVLLLAALGLPAASHAGAAGPLDPALEAKLAATTYVYISSLRKDGTFSKPAEIWFLYHDGAVWVGTPPTTWRVKRIKAKRPMARIAVGAVDGPSFVARGAIVQDPKVLDLMFETYAKKYPDRWPGYAEKFRTGMKDGSRVLVRYTPVAEAKASPAPALHTPGLGAPEPTSITPRIEDRAGGPARARDRS
jgi:hypothetical protein